MEQILRPYDTIESTTPYIWLTRDSEGEGRAGIGCANYGPCFMMLSEDSAIPQPRQRKTLNRLGAHVELRDGARVSKSWSVWMARFFICGVNSSLE